MGFRSNTPQTGIFMHLGPLMPESWITELEDKDPESKNLKHIDELECEQE